MASVIKTKGGYGVKLSPGENAARPTIGIGKVTKRTATGAKFHIEALIARRNSGRELPTATQEWLNGITDGLRKRLERLGLVESDAKNRWTVSAWVADYIKRRTDVKGDTVRKWEDVQEKLNAFFRGDALGDVTQQHAKNFRIYLQTVVRLGENTIRRHIGICRQFWNAAIEAEIVTKNPFRGQPVSVRANESRFFFVTPEISQEVLQACPDAEWRLIFGLARWGGLRCPSEVVKLRWQDVDFEKLRFTVHSPKTEHHIGQEKRVVPMFPELKPLFQDAFDNAPEGAVYCVHSCGGQWSNLGALLSKIVKRAGLEPWPKLMQNLRSTRETELFKLTGGNVKAVCSWLGNSPTVALQHYAQMTEQDIQDAAKKTVLNQAENDLKKSGHKTVHSDTETGRKEPQEIQDTVFENEEKPLNCNDLPQFTGTYENKTKNIDWALLDLNQ